MNLLYGILKVVTTSPQEEQRENDAIRNAKQGGTVADDRCNQHAGPLQQTSCSHINYQYRNGTSFPVALRTLYADGGIPRFYRGVLPALVQGPLSRFGDTAANTGVLTLMNSLDATKDLNVGFKTVAASASAAIFRIFLMPIDTVKTTMQVQGNFAAVVTKVKAGGPTVLYHGSLAAASATFVGHYPWTPNWASSVDGLFSVSARLPLVTHAPTPSVSSRIWRNRSHVPWSGDQDPCERLAGNFVLHPLEAIRGDVFR
eukprot:scaffold28743_cov45-Attheya_sp.AAC.2